MEADRVAELLRSNAARLAEAWQSEVRRGLPSAIAGERPVLRAHVDDLIAGLAAWIEGDHEAGGRAFARLVDSAGLPALGYMVGLETIISELGQLRQVIVRAVLSRDDARDLHRSLLALDAAFDRAITEAVVRFAQEREEERSRFIGILAHDLRDPLNVVLITGRILGRHPKLRAHASRIEQACERMLRMVGDVLDFARGHLGGGIPARPAPHDLGEICRAATDEVMAAHPERGIALETRGDLLASVDRDRAQQAIANLLSNAVEHGTGPIEILVEESPAHHAIVTAVTSHGTPIPSDQLVRIFDPFARADIARPSPGLGLGLYIVQQIALAHGAPCQVTSSPAATTFSIRWPRAHAHVQRRAG